MANTTFSAQINGLATRVGTECKALHSKIGTLTSLNTTTKTDIVAAINEVKSAANTLNGTLNTVSSTLEAVKKQQGTNTGNISTIQGNVSTLQSNLTKVTDRVSTLETSLENFTEIDDSAPAANKTYSSNKIESSIIAAKNAVKNELLGGAGGAYDSLKELADLIISNKDAIDAIKQLAAGHVKFDEAQSLTATQQKQARDNINAASKQDVSTIPSLTQRLGAVETKATTNATNHSNLVSNLGTLTTNFTATFETALAGK